ncbi:MAG: fumarylacetoacetate hydrolase family protein, partial [Bauldia litoralis]
MKLVSFTVDGRDSYGIVDGEEIADIGAISGAPGDLKAFLREKGIRGLADRAAVGPRVGLDAVDLLPPIPNSDKLFCIGLNYLTHIKETGRETPAHPPLFLRVASAQVGHGQAMIRPRVSEAFDFEGELAAVIGASARHVAPADALDFVAGYTCFNDGSIRDWQRHTSQFGAGKNFHRSGSMGPWLVTADEIPDPTALSLETR